MNPHSILAIRKCAAPKLTVLETIKDRKIKSLKTKERKQRHMELMNALKLICLVKM